MKVLLAFATLLEVLGLHTEIARVFTTFLLDLPNSRKQELEGMQIHLIFYSEFTDCLSSRSHWTETFGEGLL